MEQDKKNQPFLRRRRKPLDIPGSDVLWAVMVAAHAQSAVLARDHTALGEAVRDLPDDHPAKQAFLEGEKTFSAAANARFEITEGLRLAADKLSRRI